MPVVLPGNAPVQASGAPSGTKGVVPFIVGSNQYREPLFTDTWTMGASTQEFVHNINPGGFLRGVRLVATLSGGVGATAATADNPWNLFQSISLEDLDGAPLCFPMGGYAYYLHNLLDLPWNGDPAKRTTYISGINPSCELFVGTELRDTAGILANTDARAQYRLRYTVNNEAAIATGAYTTHGTLTITGYGEYWAQPDSVDMHGNPIEKMPPGLGITHLLRHQVGVLNAAGADNTVQLVNTGNELRNIIMVLRDSNGARQNYFSNPIRFRFDSKNMEVSNPAENLASLYDFYDFLKNGSTTLPAGVLAFPKFRDPGKLLGQYWLPTNNATYIIIESATPNNAVNLPGTIEIITSEVVPTGNVPGILEGV